MLDYYKIHEPEVEEEEPIDTSNFNRKELINYYVRAPTRSSIFKKGKRTYLKHRLSLVSFAMNILYIVYFLYFILGIYVGITSLFVLLDVAYSPDNINVVNNLNPNSFPSSFYFEVNGLYIGNILFLTILGLITLISRSNAMDQLSGLNGGYKWVGRLNWAVLLNYLVLSLYQFLGSRFTFYGIPINGFSETETTIYLAVGWSVLILTQIGFRKFSRPPPDLDPNIIKDEVRASKVLPDDNASIQRVIELSIFTLRVGLIFVTLYSLVIAANAAINLFRFLETDNVELFSTQRNINYTVLTFSGIMIIPILFLSKRSTLHHSKSVIRTSILRNIIFQVIFMGIFNVYLLVGTYTIYDYYPNIIYRFTMEEAITSTIFIVGYFIFILFLTRKMIVFPKLVENKTEVSG